MLKKIFLLLIVFIFFSSFQIARAEIVINEIMYDPNDGDTDWVEIYNNGNSDILITTIGALDAWRISTSINISPTKFNLNGPNLTISAGQYVILACDKDLFLSKHVGYLGTVVDITASGFNNSEGVIQIWDNTGVSTSNLHYISTQGGAGDGNSLQKISGSWKGATPTPGEANENTETPPADNINNNNSSSSGGSSSSSSVETKTKIVKDVDIKTEITNKDLAFVGIPLVFQASAFGHKGEVLNDGRYFWNFGDGDAKEITLREMNNTKKLSHTFLYPSEYNVYLEYYENYYGDVSDATDQMTIKVVPANIVISRVGNEQDFFVELSNDTDYDEDISGWILASNNKSFKIPRNTIISSKKKLILSPKITGFSILDKEILKLLTQQGNIVFDYGDSIRQDNAKETPSLILPLNKGEMPKAEGVKREQVKISEENLINETSPIPELSALAFNTKNTDVSKNNSYLPMLASMIFIGTSASAVYFIRRKKVIQKIGDDFAILDD